MKAVRKFSVAALLLHVGIVIAGCGEASTAPQKTPLGPPLRVVNRVARAPQRIVTFDELGDSVAVAVPGFGGFFVSNSRHLVVWLTDVSAAARIRAALLRYYHGEDLSNLPLEVRQGAFDVRDLRAWRTLLEDRLYGLPWVTADIDEQSNKLSFTVADASIIPRVDSIAELAGIPAGALRVSIAPQRRLTQTPDNATVSTGVRPIPGGVNMALDQYGFGCTIGFIARADSTSGQYYAVSASHCTPTLDQNDNTIWYQYGPLVMAEFYEAPFTSTLSGGPGLNPCPNSFYTCRYADAALFKFSYYNNVAFGKIARTTDSTYGYAGGSAGITLDVSTSPYSSYNIFSETTMGSFHIGDVMHLMGRASGHTYGPISRTCFDTNPLQQQGVGFIALTDKLYVCQMEADLFVEPGDSGGPIFMDGYSNNVILCGIVWEYENDGHAVFSPIDGIHYDLGPLQTYQGGSWY